MENIFFDLDGTLIESRPRLYQLFQNMIPSSKLSFDEYWTYKRNKISHKEILQNVFSYSLEDISKFEKEWLERIELPEWLVLDTPFEGISDYLNKLKYTYKIFIVTSRQSEKRALEQIDQFGWLDVVKKVFVTGQTQEKHDLIKNGVTIHSKDWFVGDTGKDIQTGKRLGINTAAVLTGFLNEKKLLEYKPDIIEREVIKLNFNK
ncbi:HAD family hydrolase [Mucilaginibacter arboris]|uniref:phosphoglycolate phosphatase n=1 Tax=Mucilaginibacter arboris TaxID=2682090 RepID=A0A7K1SVD8_9SPHI|nr:HAD hydrolase-like protein [Mucilaginibacter arboris]MVN21010.1 HAD hydrolase-like protein [Mucilaginibacter arboris]